ncbi:hypothetical protein [Polaromonas sp. UC242_47]|uniref:hypothetical protein n=1 Tax=Polaromonas sp. UC242_47 TaxID=3374626 RepID=UPI0037AFC18D
MKTMTPFTTLLGRFAQHTRLQPGFAIALAALFLLALLPRDACAQAQTFNYTGALQTYTVPAGAAGVTIVANGAGGGSGGNDANGWGGAGGDGARATGTYLAAPGTVLNIYVGQGGQSGKTSDGNPYTRTTAVGAGGLAGGTTGYAGGVGGTPGGSGWSGGGAGGGAASVVATSGNTRVLIAGGGGGGQGGALDVMGRAGLDASATGAMPGAAGQAGTGRANGEDGAGGGGGGAGCPRGTGGGAVADSSGANNTAQATGGGSCNTAAVTGFSVIGGGGGAGGPSVTGVAPASGNPGSNGSVIITPIIPALSLNKSQPSPALQAAVNSVYTLTVTNSGTGPASAARVLDQLPTNMTYVSGTGTGWTCSSAANGSGTLVTCNFVGTIAAGSGSSTITITAKPTNTTTAITNYAAVGSNGTTTVPIPTTCTAADTPTAGCAAPVTNSVVLGLLKSAPSPALQVGSNSAYTLTVTNNGTATATTARVVDQLPTNMTYVSGTGSGWTCTPTGSTLVTCNFVGTLSAGGGTSTITITATPTSTASVINRAAVDPTGGTTPPTASTCTATNAPSAGCAAPVTNTPTSVILGLVKSVPTPALQVGNNSAYTLTVTNSGTAGTTTARVVDQLPANMTYVSGTGTGWTCTPSGSTLVTCDYSGSIAASGGTAAVVITATPTSTTSVINRAAVDPTGGATPPTAGTCTAANTPSAGCAAPITSTPTSVILGLVKSAPSPALQVGSNSAYTLTVTNTGTAVSTTARITDQLPANLTYVSGVGAGWTCTAAAGLVTCNYSGSIAVGGGAAAVVITVTPTSTAAVTNYASVDPTGGTTTPTPTTCTAANAPTAGCAAPVTNTPTSVMLGLVKSTPSPALQVGNNSVYTLTVTNTGTAASTTARIVDQLPANLTYVSGAGAGWTCTVAGSLVTCNYSGTLAASGGAAAVAITVTPTSTASVTNFASVDPTGGTAPPTSTTCTAANAPSAGCAAPVTSTPTSVILGLVKSAPSPALKVGSNSAYTLTVTNAGTAATTTARVVDQLPANMTYVSGTGTGWTCTPTGSTLVTCSFAGTLGAGGTSTITITATPTSTASVTNYASVDPTGGTATPTPTTCTAANAPSAGCAAPVTSTPTSVILGLVKSAPSPALLVGSNSAYTLTVTNSGTAATTTARVVDQLPANMSYVGGTGTGWTCTPSGSTLVTCDYTGSIAASGGAASFVITATPTSTSSVTNYAAVDPTGGTVTPTPTTCTAANAPTAGCAAPVTSTATSVILGLVKSTPSPALQVGSNSAYTLTVTNTGTAATTSARVVDQLPANLTYVSGTGTNWSCSVAAGLVTCDYSGPAIAASGGTAAVVVTVTPTSTAQVINRAAVDPTGGATPPTASTCTAANTPSAGCAAPVTSTPTSVILGLVKSAPSPALQVGSNSAYTLTVSNTGTTASTTARVVDQLPANLTYVSGLGTGWTCSTAANAGGTLVTCDYSGSIAGGGNAVLVITVTPTSSAPVTNYASVDPTGGTVPPVPTTCTAANVPSAGCAAPVSTTAGRLVAGNVYSDTNHNGNLDAGEAGIGGASALFVKLAPLSGGVCTGPATAAAPVSLSSGAYSLPSVAQGSYCLIVDGNSTLSDITPAYPAGWIGTQNPTGVIQLVVGAAPPAPQNFGLYNGSKLSGTVFADNGAGGGTANNGIKAGAEAGLAGLTVNAMQGAITVDSEPTASDGSFILWVPASTTGTVVITPVLPAGYVATGGSAGSTGGSYVRPSVSYTAAAGQSATGVNFGMVAPNTLSPNGAQTAQPGTTVFYAHAYKAGTGGQVSFTLANTATPASPAWSQVLYQDSNCNATLEASEPPVTAAITVTAGQTVCLIVKQFVPAGAGQGAQNSVTLSAAFTYTNASPALAVNTLSATDITTVGQAGDLSLAKLVSNITQALPAATGVNASPGDTLEYKLTATNNGTQPLSTLFVSDSTTAFTGFVSAACPLPASLPAGITACAVTTQPAVGAQGALKWTFTGSLAPSAQLIVTYRVKVDQ